MKYPLTSQQRNIWNLMNAYNARIANISGLFTFDAELDLKILAEAINMFVKSQEGVRLQIHTDGQNAFQVPEEYRHFDVPVLEFDSLKSAEEYFKAEGSKPFRANGKLYKFSIYKTEGKTGVFPCISHLVADAWSLSLFCDSIIRYYCQLADTGNTETPVFSYLEYVVKESQYTASQRYARDKSFWETRFPERPFLSQIVPERTASADGMAERYSTVMGANISRQIRSCCADHGISPAIVFEAAVLIYLHGINITPSENIIGVPVLNRTSRREKQIVGMFISTVPLGIRVDDESSAAELFKAISSAHRTLFRHQQYPYSDILHYLREKHGIAGSLFDVVVSYQNARISEATEYAYHTKWLHNGCSEIPLVLHIDDRDGRGDFTVNLDYQTAVFTDAHVRLLFTRLRYIISQITSHADAAVGNIRIIPEDEYNRVVYGFNDTHSDYCRSKCVHELFSKQAAKNPGKTALVFNGRNITYRELDEASNSLAHYLREKLGIKPNEIVPIISKRGWQVVAAMLGVMKAGGAYMPVDPAYPKDRVLFMAGEAKSRAALTFGYTGDIGVDMVNLGLFDFCALPEQIENVSSPNDTCYVIFTSGSTGNPKGTLISHRGLNNFTSRENVFYKAIFNGCDRVLAIGSIAFDISIGEIIQPLVNGASLVLAAEADLENANRIAHLIIEEKVDLIHITPSRLLYYLSNTLFRKAIGRVKTILSAGEAFPAAVYDGIRKYTDAKIFNGYGPTETTIGSTFTEIKSADMITIGKPMSNVLIYVLDKLGRPCPIGVPGEICISGDGVGYGYLNRPELTAEKFVQNPFAAGKTMYKSGDLAAWLVDGNLEYLGRIDSQVKIRGLRIELGEIESIMRTFEGIKMSAAAARQEASGRQYLVGYYTSDKAIDETRLREYLASKLPRYMVPNYFVQLENIPMTLSGKTDRKNLPDPKISIQANLHTEPATATERAICESAGRLGISAEPGDNFFEHGGDSLMAIQLIMLLSEKGYTVSMQDIYEYPTPAELGSFLDGRACGHDDYVQGDFAGYDRILRGNTSCTAYRPEGKPLGDILLTGATGFLGAHLLDAALSRQAGAVYCLVRSAERFRQALQYYFGSKYAGEQGRRIIPVTGDITDRGSLSKLPKGVCTVIHAAANVKHYGEYCGFKAVNVDGTGNMLDYACAVGAQFAYISTTSVGGLVLKNIGKNKALFTEADFYIGQDLSNVYIRSKFEAERLVLDKIDEGMSCRIFRMGNLTNRYSDGVFQANDSGNAFWNRLRTFISVGAVPEILAEEYAEMTPADMAAEAVILLEEHAAKQQTVFHVANCSNAVTYRDLGGMIAKQGIGLEIMETGAFLERLNALPDAGGRFAANELSELQRIRSLPKVTVDSSYTEGILKSAGFAWRSISDSYLGRYMRYFKDARKIF